ncbi:MAG TPA: AzlD domain-containing protein [Naasia sp.]
MTLWHIVLLASFACLALKFAGYLVPARVLEHPTAARTANLVTVALLAALIAVQTLGVGMQLVLDARLPAVLLAAVLFALRVPFVLVILAAAVLAAVLRLLGWAA